MLSIQSGFFWCLGVLVAIVFSSWDNCHAQREIKIGLLIHDSTCNSAVLGATMAINKANSSGGHNGRPFQLAVASMDGQWGTGSIKAVDLIFDDNVVAILGSHTGRDAHLVEQVAAKTRVVFMSAWAADPTLSQAFIPFFFNCAPNNVQQSDAIINELFVKNKITGAAVMDYGDYDSDLASKTLVKRIKSAGYKGPESISCSDVSACSGSLAKSSVKDLIFPGDNFTSKNLNRYSGGVRNLSLVLGLSDINDPSVVSEEFGIFESVIMVSPGYRFTQKGKQFIQEYEKIYGHKPGPRAAYAFDGMGMIIESIRKAGADRENVQEALSEINYEGVTGLIKFDEKGNRTGVVTFEKIK